MLCLDLPMRAHPRSSRDGVECHVECTTQRETENPIGGAGGAFVDEVVRCAPLPEGAELVDHRVPRRPVGAELIVLDSGNRGRELHYVSQSIAEEEIPGLLGA